MAIQTKKFTRSIKKQRPTFHRECRACHEAFTTHSNRQAFCLRDKCDGGKYKPEEKIPVKCQSCSTVFQSNRRNQTHCSKSECQAARNEAKMNNYILRKAKEIGE